MINAICFLLQRVKIAIVWSCLLTFSANTSSKHHQSCASAAGAFEAPLLGSYRLPYAACRSGRSARLCRITGTRTRSAPQHQAPPRLTAATAAPAAAGGARGRMRMRPWTDLPPHPRMPPASTPHSRHASSEPSTCEPFLTVPDPESNILRRRDGRIWYLYDTNVYSRSGLASCWHILAQARLCGDVLAGKEQGRATALAAPCIGR